MARLRKRPAQQRHFAIASHCDKPAHRSHHVLDRVRQWKEDVIETELLNQLLAGRDPNDVFAKYGLFDDLKKALSDERILNVELDEQAA